MTLTIDIRDPLRARLERTALRRGLGPSDLALELIEQSLDRCDPVPAADAATLALLAQWAKENEAGGSGEEELQALKRALNANRASGRTPFP